MEDVESHPYLPVPPARNSFSADGAPPRYSTDGSINGTAAAAGGGGGGDGVGSYLVSGRWDVLGKPI